MVPSRSQSKGDTSSRGEASQGERCRSTLSGLVAARHEIAPPRQGLQRKLRILTLGVALPSDPLSNPPFANIMLATRLQ